MRLIHFSDAPVKLGDLVARGQDEEGGMKPKELWLSDEAAECSWSWWCRSENFRLQMLTHVHRVTLSNCANVLILETPGLVRDFGREFAIQHGPFAGGSMLGHHIMMLDWVRVIQRWHGLIITPYQWDCRLESDTFWYYGWDCASGVIWEPTAIGSVILDAITEVPTPFYPDDEDEPAGDKPIDE
jgi:hypothetical protein